MDSMAEELNQLIALQNVDIQLMEIEELKGDLPQEVAQLNRDLDDLGAGIQQHKDQLEGLAKDERHHQAQVTDSRVLLAKYQDQLLLVSSNRAYDALMSEIDGAKKIIDDGEMSLLEIEEQTHQISDQLKADELSLGTKTTQIESRKKSLAATIAETEKEAKTLTRQRTKLQGAVERRIYQTYERIRGAKGGVAVVPMTRGSCGSCYNELPAQLQREVKAMDQTLPCPSCGVILYYESE